MTCCQTEISGALQECAGHAGPENALLMQGGWANDLKQGLGKKVYANGDVYEGLWRGGKCEGPGRYRWKNNNEYDGEWKAGRMHGRGTLKWHTGAHHDWLRGKLILYHGSSSHPAISQHLYLASKACLLDIKHVKPQ